jgi:hypothetical protein
MKNFFCLCLTSLFVISMTNFTFAKKNAGITTSSTQLKSKIVQTKNQQQNPLPKGFNEATEIYFKQRIDLEEIAYDSRDNVSAPVKFFKIKLDGTKSYSLIDLENMEISRTKKTSLTWKDFKGAYGYKFDFELVKSKEQYLFIKIEPFAKEGEKIPYAYAVFNNYQKEVTFEAMVYEENPYKGFIKKILEVN